MNTHEKPCKISILGMLNKLIKRLEFLEKLAKNQQKRLISRDFFSWRNRYYFAKYNLDKLLHKPNKLYADFQRLTKWVRAVQKIENYIINHYGRNPDGTPYKG